MEGRERTPFPLFGGAFDEDEVWEPQVGFEARDQFGRLVNVAA